MVGGAQSAGGAPPDMSTVLPVTIVVPTIGRVPRLEACLRSIRACDPAADELLIVDQSGSDDTARLVEEAGDSSARRVRSRERGTGAATNLGLREARHETVLVTHDDCTVARDWVRAAYRLACEDREAVFTGRVLPRGDPRNVPSVIDDPLPHDYTGEVQCGALYPNNMVLNRRLALELGGFDDRVLFAEDNDFCYRWLRAGLRLRYEPSLVTWHHEWRTSNELEELYVRYGRGQGVVYMKHLCRGDLALAPFLLRDLVSALRYVWGRLGVDEGERDPWVGYPRGLPIGLLEGLRQFCRRRRRRSSPSL
jgi:GT2 family glycosyltransferase